MSTPDSTTLAAHRVVEYLLDLSHLVETSETPEERQQHRAKMRDQQARVEAMVAAGLSLTPESHD